MLAGSDREGVGPLSGHHDHAAAAIGESVGRRVLGRHGQDVIGPAQQCRAARGSSIGGEIGSPLHVRFVQRHRCTERLRYAVATRNNVNSNVCSAADVEHPVRRSRDRLVAIEGGNVTPSVAADVERRPTRERERAALTVVRNGVATSAVQCAPAAVEDDRVRRPRLRRDLACLVLGQVDADRTAADRSANVVRVGGARRAAADAVSDPHGVVEHERQRAGRTLDDGSIGPRRGRGDHGSRLQHRRAGDCSRAGEHVGD